MNDTLRSSDERFRMAARATNDVLWDWNLETNMVSWNEALVTVLGYGGVVETPLEWWVERVHPEDHARVKETLHAALAGDETWSGSYRFRRNDGSYADIFDRGFIARDGDKPYRMVGTMVDMTERNRMQQRLVQADRLAAVGMLAGGVGHEINNPLSYVLSNASYLESLLAGTPGPDALAEARTALEELRAGAERIRDVVKSLKLFADAEPTVREVDVVPVLDSALALARNKLRNRARLVREIEAIPPVSGDPARLAQVFVSLLVNATDAIAQEPGEQHEIRVSTRVEGDRVAVGVSDTGRAFTLEERRRLFDPFFTTKSSGMGLGISIAHQIVVSMGGELRLDSDPDCGNTFTVILPHARLAGMEQASPAPRGRQRFLVVDEDAAVGRSIGRMLRAEADVDVVQLAPAALDLLAQRGAYTLILCDVTRPECAADEFYASVTPAMKKCIVFMSGGRASPRIRAFLQSVSNPVIDKPIDYRHLRSLIAERR
jgi:PAS domain S-box-containing protein